VKLLLDTHVVIWWATGSPRLPAAWIEAIVDPDNEAYVSAASAWEIEIKKRTGRLRFSPTAMDVADEAGFDVMAINGPDAVLAGALDWDHRDPFDRMLAAQAIAGGMVLITDDDRLRAAPGVRVL
jgi:PIN domain nuclease of toxin-antitoxin system